MLFTFLLFCVYCRLVDLSTCLIVGLPNRTLVHLSTQKEMKYSIIIPVYNRPDEVDELLDSLTRQSETDFEVAGRIKEQGEYFGINEDDVLARGKEAKEFSQSQLERPFTVMTRFLDAMGRSDLPRNYAFIITAEGEDLGQVLVANGLARAWGQRAVGLESIYDTLKGLEKEAQQHKRGAWQVR